MEQFLNKLSDLRFDKKNTVIYVGISVLVYYFLEKVEFRKIALFIFIFIGVFFYFKKNEIMGSTKKRQSQVTGSPTHNNNNNLKANKTINIGNKIKKFKIKNEEFTDKIHKINNLDGVLERLDKFIHINYQEIVFSYGETSKKNLNLNLYHNIKKKLKAYLNQVEVILVNEYCLDKSFEKLIAIKKEIIYLIHSMYFKINHLYDHKINEFMTEIKDIFENIESQLKLRINKDFFENPNYLKGLVGMEGDEPEKYDPHESLNHIPGSDITIKPY